MRSFIILRLLRIVRLDADIPHLETIYRLFSEYALRAKKEYSRVFVTALFSLTNCVAWF